MEPAPPHRGVSHPETRLAPSRRSPCQSTHWPRPHGLATVDVRDRLAESGGQVWLHRLGSTITTSIMRRGCPWSIAGGLAAEHRQTRSLHRTGAVIEPRRCPNGRVGIDLARRRHIRPTAALGVASPLVAGHTTCAARHGFRPVWLAGSVPTPPCTHGGRARTPLRSG